MTWEELVAIEPALRSLEEEARAYAKVDALKRQLLRYAPLLPPEVHRWAEHTCANYLWYRRGGLKERLSDLVGYGARNPALRSEEAYNVAYDYLYALLPNCRNCCCW
ncbi:MAG: hypothetical protein C4295_06790 [Candidatus Fervidibacterota bacterium]